MVCLLKTFRNQQMLYAAVTHLDDIPSLEALLALKVEKSQTRLVGTRRTAVSIIVQEFICP
jgi:hypothetical protein